MDARYVQRGDAIDHTPEADVAAGDVVVMSGKLIGVAKLDIKAGEHGALALTGVYEMPKAAGTAFGLGAEVGWNAAERQVVAAGSSGSVRIGHAVAPAEEAGLLVLVRLCQGLN